MLHGRPQHRPVLALRLLSWSLNLMPLPFPVFLVRSQAKASVVPSASTLIIKALKEPLRDRKKEKNSALPLLPAVVSSWLPWCSTHALCRRFKLRVLRKSD